MSKKDFEAVAIIIRNQLNSLAPNDSYSYYTLREVAEQFIIFFRSKNQKFDREKFLKACGYNVS